jgi:hypothetical protein
MASRCRFRPLRDVYGVLCGISIRFSILGEVRKFLLRYLEGCRIRNAYGYIGKDRKHFVSVNCSEREVVSYLVDGKE